MKTRNVILATLTLTFALFICPTAANSQTSTPKTVLSDAQKEVHQEATAVSHEAQQLLLELRIKRLLAEVRAGRELVAKQREELATADSQLASEKANSASLERSNGLAEVESQHKSMAIAYQKDALDTKAEMVAVLKERNDELKRSASKNRKRALWATAAAVILGGVLVMK